MAALKDVAHGSMVSTGTLMNLGAFVVNARVKPGCHDAKLTV
jgi:hypothetical protein